MTTILQASIPGASPFDRHSMNSSSYPDLPSTHHRDPQSPYMRSEYHRTYPSTAPSSTSSSPTYVHFSRQDSSTSTSASSLSLNQSDPMQADDGQDDDMAFPAFGQSTPSLKRPRTREIEMEDDPHTSRTTSPPGENATDMPESVQDDQDIEPEPTRHVDYLSHEWKEEDIWSSWRYIVRRRKKIANSVRLENAAWRTWVKAKYNLKTISPETLNWLKDCDVTWLYGPLQVEAKKSLSVHRSPPTSRLSTSSSFLCKKPILKKKSASAVILERSRSQHSLLQRASEIIRQQQASPAHGRPILRSEGADFTLESFTGSSVANTPAEHDASMHGSHRPSFIYPETPLEQKHVLFDEEVRQVRAIDSDDEEEKFNAPPSLVSESDEDDDGGLVMAPKPRSSSRSTPRGSFSSDSKTIIPLPSTTLKYRTDTPEPPQGATNISFRPGGRKLSPSPSQETLRPSHPHHNFLIDDDPEVTDGPWDASNDLGYSPYEDENEPGPHMRRTESGMFMPYDEDGDEAAMNKTLFGQAAYAVNTFKDIAHVVWNVGWTRK